MTTEEKKKQRKLLQQLSSADEETVLRTIQEIRDKGNPTYVPALIGIYQSTPSHIIRDRILRLFSDLKSQEAVMPFVQELFHIKNPELKRSMIEACWLSGLDFSVALDPFFETLLSEDYAMALEAFTVIENNLQHLDHGILKEYGTLLNEKIQTCDPQVLPLARQLHDIINDTILFSDEPADGKDQ